MQIGTTEREQLLHVLTAPLGAAEERVQHGALDWRNLLDGAEQYGVLPALCAQVTGWNLPGQVRAEVAEHMSSSAASNTLLLSELARIVTRLTAERIPSVVLKGCALLLNHYRYRGARHVDDIDILVPKPSVRRVTEILGRLGYTSALSGKVSLDGRPQEEYDAERAHAPLPMCNEAGVAVDLHWSLPTRLTQHRRDFESLYDRAVEVEHLGTVVRVPRADDLRRIVCDHVVVHHFLAPRYLPRHLVDIQVLDETSGPANSRGCRSMSPSVRLSYSLLRAARGPDSLLNPLRTLLFPKEGMLSLTDMFERVGGRWKRRYRDVTIRPGIYRHKLLPRRAYIEQHYGATTPWSVTYHYLRRLIPGLPSDRAPEKHE